MFCLTIFVVITGTILVSTYMASATPGRKGSGRILEKKTFIHFKKGRARPDKPGKPGGGKKEDEGYYTYIAKGLRWKMTEPFVFNLNNTALTEAFVYNSLCAGMAEWETYGGDIFGELSVDNTAEYDQDKTDDKNTFTFGIYEGSYSGVIAVTSVWGYFNAPPPYREIVEVDVLFNTENIDWGDVIAEKNEELMDLLNIAIHEIGHCAGMGDLYLTDAIKETMYGYSGEGDTEKRDLYIGDIAGIENLYK